MGPDEPLREVAGGFLENRIEQEFPFLEASARQPLDLHEELRAEAAEDLLDEAVALCSHTTLDADVIRALVVRLNLIGQSGSRGLGTIARDPEFFEVLCERMATLPLPAFPESVRDSTRSSLSLSSWKDEEGFLGDFLELCRRSVEDPAMRDHLLEGVQAEVLKKLHRRYIPAELDLEGLKNDSKAVAALLNEAGDLVARMFLESRDIHS